MGRELIFLDQEQLAVSVLVTRLQTDRPAFPRRSRSRRCRRSPGAGCSSSIIILRRDKRASPAQRARYVIDRVLTGSRRRPPPDPRTRSERHRSSAVTMIDRQMCRVRTGPPSRIWQTSKPSMPGIMTSRRMRSGSDLGCAFFNGRLARSKRGQNLRSTPPMSFELRSSFTFGQYVVYDQNRGLSLTHSQITINLAWPAHQEQFYA